MSAVTRIPSIAFLFDYQYLTWTRNWSDREVSIFIFGAMTMKNDYIGLKAFLAEMNICVFVIRWLLCVFPLKAENRKMEIIRNMRTWSTMIVVLVRSFSPVQFFCIFGSSSHAL